MSQPKPGDRVRVSGHVHVAGEDQRAHHGDEGRIMRTHNQRHRSAISGEVVVPVQLDDGSVIVVPEKALEKNRNRHHG